MVIEIYTNEGREVIRYPDESNNNSLGSYTLFTKDLSKVLKAKIMSTKEIILHVVNAVNSEKHVVVL